MKTLEQRMSEVLGVQLFRLIMLEAQVEQFQEAASQLPVPPPVDPPLDVEPSPAE